MAYDPFTRPVPTLAQVTAQTARDVDEVHAHPGRYFRPGTPSYERERVTMPDAYDPLTGANWDQVAATVAWGQSMDRTRREQIAPQRWQLHGRPGSFRWVFFRHGPWTGQVTIEADGFHWVTTSYDTGQQEHAGVTTSLYEAYQSVEQNKTVNRAG